MKQLLPAQLLYNTVWEHHHHLPLGLSSVPEASSPLGAPPAVGCAPLPWLYSTGLPSKQLKLAFVHLFNRSPHISHCSGKESIDELNLQAENLHAFDFMVFSQVFHLTELWVGYVDISACLFRQVVLKKIGFLAELLF